MRRCSWSGLALVFVLALGGCKCDAPAPGGAVPTAGPEEKKAKEGPGSDETKTEARPTLGGISTETWPDACIKAVACGEALTKLDRDIPAKALAAEWSAAAPKIHANPAEWEDRCRAAYEELIKTPDRPQHCR